MTPGLGRRAGAAAAILFAFVVLGPASPAGADPVITIDKPAAAATLESAAVTISGSTTASSTLLDPLAPMKQQVTVTLGGKTLLSKECPTKQCDFSTNASLPLNGPYKVTVNATESNGLASGSSTLDRSFAVAAPPAKPVADQPKLDDSRNVLLTWSRNSEGDFLYYAVFRKDPGTTKYFQVGGKITLPATGKPSFTDLATSQLGAGDYSYQIVAVRMGATGTAASEKLSDPSVAVAATVPAPPTTTSSTVLGGPGSPAAGPTTTVKPGPPAGVDLSGFLSSRSQPVTLPTITIPEPPDTGFKNTLPFGARQPGDELEEGDAEATPPRSGGGGDSAIVSIATGRPLVPVAGGLVLLLLALHMRILSRRVKAPASADLPVVSPPLRAPALVLPGPSTAAVTRPVVVKAAAPPPPPPPTPAPEPHAPPAAHETAADEDWAPPAPSPEVTAKPKPRPAPVAPARPEPIASPEEIEVFEVVSSSRRPLARAGSR